MKTEKESWKELIERGERVLDDPNGDDLLAAVSKFVDHAKKVQQARLGFQVRSEGLVLLLSPFVEAILEGDDRAAFAEYLKILDYTRKREQSVPPPPNRPREISDWGYTRTMLEAAGLTVSEQWNNHGYYLIVERPDTIMRFCFDLHGKFKDIEFE